MFARLIFAGLMLASTMAGAQTLSRDQIKAIVAAPDRSAADHTNDQRRHPEDILAFIDIKPGITALDVFAGGGYDPSSPARSARRARSTARAGPD